MFMIHSGLDIVYGSVWQATTLENLQPFCGCLSTCLGLYQSFNGYTVLDAVVIGQEANISGPFWFTQFGAKDAKETIIAAAKEDTAVEGFEARVWNDRCCVSLESDWEHLTQKGRNIRCAVPHRPESGFPLMRAELAKFVNVAT